jgi:RimJ/RimL family protein N-acetyltransferase
MLQRVNLKNFSQFIRNDIIFKQKMKVDSTMIEGRFIKLIPLELKHLDELYEAGKYPQIWQFNTSNIQTKDQMKKYIEKALEGKDKGVAIPYVLFDKISNSLVGSTRYYNIDTSNYHLDLGYTWITPSFQKSYVNTESKLLMLGQAFEKWNAIRVGFRVGPNNIISQKSVEKLGASREGILRNVMILETNKLRDSVIFSILDSEWEGVKKKLEDKIYNRK